MQSRYGRVGGEATGVPSCGTFIKPHSEGARIWTAVQGRGVPVLLCNGGPGCCDYLGPVADMLDDLAQVIRFEARGCGRSDALRPYDIPACLADLECIRMQYGIEKWVVGGHSWGPDLAMAYALTHPDRVLGLLGISGGVLHKDRAWSEQYHRLKASVGERDPPFLFPPNMEVNRETNASWAEFVREPGLLRRVANLDCPALYVYGEMDIRPAWPVRQTAALLPRGRFVMIQGAAHAIWLTHAKELQAQLREFLNEICANRS